VSSPVSLSAQIGLRGPVVVWVLAAHAWALLVPLALIAVVFVNSEFVAARADFAWGFYVAAGVMMAGSAFEIAQNTIDRWYLTRESASAEGKSLCDLLFFWMIVASQALVIFACYGRWVWLTTVVVLLTVAYPWFYVRKKLDIVPLALLGIGSVIAMWFSFGDPIVFLQLLISPLTGVIFAALLSSGAQFLHGFVTLVASSNPLFMVWAIFAAARGAPTSWPTVGFGAMLLIILIAVIPRLTNNLSATAQSTND